MMSSALIVLRSDDSISDLTCHITKLGLPARHGSFSQVYQYTMVTSEGKIEVCLYSHRFRALRTFIDMPSGRSEGIVDQS
jgi:hypothetical protein